MIDYQGIARSHGLCGDLSPDGQRLCILEPGHKQPHPWSHNIEEAAIAFVRSAEQWPYDWPEAMFDETWGRYLDLARIVNGRDDDAD